MNMIGHDAVGMDCEIPCGGFGAEHLEKPVAGCRVGEYWAPVEAADRHKIVLVAYVIVGREANTLMEEHVRDGKSHHRDNNADWLAHG